MEKQELAKRGLWKVWLSLPIDGSADHELDIKGFDPEDLEIGDWRIDLESIETRDQYADVEETDVNDKSVEFVAYGE